MRIPIASSLVSRDGTVGHDARVVNGTVEIAGEKSILRNRPGLASLAQFTAGQAQFLGEFLTKPVIVINDSVILNGLTIPTTTALNPIARGLRYSARNTGAGIVSAKMLLKNEAQAWTISGTSVIAALTDTDYPANAQITLSSLSRVGSVATAITAANVTFQVGAKVTISGASPADYNGVKLITSVQDATSGSNTIALTITRTAGTAYATSASAHGLSSGNAISVSGATAGEYNGIKTVTVTDSTHFNYPVSYTPAVAEAPSSPASGGYYVAGYTYLQTRSGVSVTRSGTTLTVYWPELSGYGTKGRTTFTLSGTTYWDGSHTVNSFYDSGGYTWVTTTVADSGPTSQTAGSVYWNTPTITSIVRASGTGNVTVTSSGNPVGYNSQVIGDLTIAGASPTAYNSMSTLQYAGTNSLSATVAWTPATAELPATPAAGSPVFSLQVSTQPYFTFDIAGSPATPATGTITAVAGSTTVRGIVNLDEYFFVMDVFGKIYNSAYGDPTSWNALDFIQANGEPGSGKAIYRNLNYVVALKEWSTEFFYNAGNATGSPLSRVDNGFTLIGCVHGDSVAELDGKLVWVSQVRQQGRSVHVMLGTQQEEISDPSICRILEQDPFDEVYAYGIKLGQQSYYVLVLPGSHLTLVCNLASKAWVQWTSMASIATARVVTSLTQTGGVATMVPAATTDLYDGCLVTITGATPSDYNGVHLLSRVSDTEWVFPIGSTTAATATGTITYNGFTEDYFAYGFSTYCNNANLLLHATSGAVVKVQETSFMDVTLPILLSATTQEVDDGSTKNKTIGKLEIIGNKVASTALVRWTDDDYTSYSAFRMVDLSAARAQLRRCGDFRRRAFEVRFSDAVGVQLTELEM